MYWFFLSIRSNDEPQCNEALHDELAAHFGKRTVFNYVDDPSYSEPFNERILTEIVPRCKALLVVIGRHWLSEENRRRLHDPLDIVRHEIEAAGASGVPVITVLLGSDAETPFPSAELLPESLRFLSDPKLGHERLPMGHMFQAHAKEFAKRLELRFGMPPDLPEPELFREYLLERRRGRGGTQWEFFGREWLWDEIQRWRNNSRPTNWQDILWLSALTGGLGGLGGLYLGHKKKQNLAHSAFQGGVTALGGLGGGLAGHVIRPFLGMREARCAASWTSRGRLCGLVAALVRHGPDREVAPRGQPGPRNSWR